MAQIIGLPKLSPTMEEGVLVRWVKKEGDKVSPGDLVAEVETDKANMDFNMEDDGVLLKLLVKEGETVKLGAPVAILGKEGEDVSALVEQAKAGGGGAAAAPAAAPEAKPAPKAEAAPAPKAEGKPAPKAEAKAAAKADAAPEGGGDGQPAKPSARPGPADAGAGPETSTAAPAARKQTPAQAAPRPAQGAEPDAGNRKPDAAASRLLASPLAKSLAIELGIDLRTVSGTGPGGRIVERDVRAAASGAAGGPAPAQRADSMPSAPAGPPVAEGAAAEAEPGGEAGTAIAVRGPSPVPMTTEGDFTDQPASNMRKRIAARLTEAKRDVPHFYLMRTLDAAPLLAFRARLNELLGDRGKVSVNDLIIKAVALALRRMPSCNAAWVGDAIRMFHRVHVGVAVAIEDGLVTPVVRDADMKGIGQIAAEVQDLAERARSRRLKAHEITGSTFTVSNLGMFSIERFTAILNPPEAGILAIGGVVDTPVVKDGQVGVGKRMTVTMSCDHRVIDGALGARWLAVFAELFERPESLAL